MLEKNANRHKDTISQDEGTEALHLTKHQEKKIAVVHGMDQENIRKNTNRTGMIEGKANEEILLRGSVEPRVYRLRRICVSAHGLVCWLAAVT